MTEVRGRLSGTVPELYTEEGIAMFLSDVLTSGGGSQLVEALKSVAWARTISHLAIKLDVPRPKIEQMMNGAVPLTMEVMAPLLAEFGVRLTVIPSTARVDSSTESPSGAYIRRF